MNIPPSQGYVPHKLWQVQQNGLLEWNTGLESFLNFVTVNDVRYCEAIMIVRCIYSTVRIYCEPLYLCKFRIYKLAQILDPCMLFKFTNIFTEKQSFNSQIFSVFI